MTEKRMVFFHTHRLAKEFHMTSKKVAILLQELGAKIWTNSDNGHGSTWYWEE